MKIKAIDKNGNIVSIVEFVNIDRELTCSVNRYVTAIVVDKKGRIAMCNLNTLTVIDEEYLPKEGKG